MGAKKRKVPLRDQVRALNQECNRLVGECIGLQIKREAAENMLAERLRVSSERYADMARKADYLEDQRLCWELRAKNNQEAARYGALARRLLRVLDGKPVAHAGGPAGILGGWWFLQCVSNGCCYMGPGLEERECPDCGEVVRRVDVAPAGNNGGG